MDFNVSIFYQTGCFNLYVQESIGFLAFLRDFTILFTLCRSRLTGLVLLPLCFQGCPLRHVLCLALQVVLREVATLAHTVGVVRLVGMATRRSHFCLSLVLVATVAHIFGVRLLISMRTCHQRSTLWHILGSGDLQRLLKKSIIRKRMALGCRGPHHLLECFHAETLGLHRLIFLDLLVQLLDFSLQGLYHGILLITLRLLEEVYGL
jgi:hypothetical protein